MNETPGKILAIDIGGSHIKASVISEEGKLLMDYEKLETPSPAEPESVLQTIKDLVKNFMPYDKISAGFPGFVKDGVVYTAPNLAAEKWQKIRFADMLQSTLGKPARVVNDADMLGLGVISGKGVEMMVTLGTGFGTAFFRDGVLLPHLELAHHPITSKNTYDSYLGDKAIKEKGEKKWNKRMEKAIRVLKTVFNYDTLYLGGGNASKIKFKLDDNIKMVTNQEGIDGGAKLWAQEKA